MSGGSYHDIARTNCSEKRIESTSLNYAQQGRTSYRSTRVEHICSALVGDPPARFDRRMSARADSEGVGLSKVRIPVSYGKEGLKRDRTRALLAAETGVQCAVLWA